MGVSLVTYNQPLYEESIEIIDCSSTLPNIFLRQGGYYLLMSYLSCFRHIMGESRLSDQWKTVYATNSVKHMLSDRAYTRVFLVHMLSSALVMARLLVTPDCPSGIKLHAARMVHKMLLNHPSSPKSLLTGLLTIQVSQIIEDLKEELSLSSRTGKLWILYLKMPKNLLLFIQAESTTD